ncbi:MAG: hypothetical protein QXM68_00900 [Candidatus Aenigmatarchaeota archaeon]|nr:hypothetical protein [Candidatus Aenigmarchaeota archaeon]
MCDIEKGIMCKNYSTCPTLISITQINYMNRTLDSIFQSLNRIEKHLDKINGNNGKE